MLYSVSDSPEGFVSGSHRDLVGGRGTGRPKAMILSQAQRITWMSPTLVSVGPVTTRSDRRSKKE